ncbi:MAG TPA: response regulator [Nitratidesulfovibrio sp.]|nr:response regulator [Nitratidesulfovibrio sp.]
MAALAAIISALGSFAWPVLIYVIFRKCGPHAIEALRNLHKKDIRIKAGDYELSLEEAASQQGTLLQDITKRIAEIESCIHTEGQTTRYNNKCYLYNAKILWVDDKPSNNYFIMGTLEQSGVNIIQSTTTSDALYKFKNGDFNCIISDIQRPEDDRAGISLTKEIRKLSNEIPIFIFCGSWAAKNLRADAIQAGANGITSSGLALTQMVFEQFASTKQS